MSIFNSAIDTKTTILGMRTFTDVMQPNCLNCFVLSGRHIKTNDVGYAAFCTKGHQLQKVGPYNSYYEALQKLFLTKGCDSCQLNKSPLKQGYLPILNEKIKDEIAELYGTTDLSITINPLHRFAEYRNYVDINFKDKFGMRLFNPLPDDLVVGYELLRSCSCQMDFALKIAALAGIIDRIDINELKSRLKEPPKVEDGSLKILEKFLRENYVEIPTYIFSNFRTLFSIRNRMIPMHATTPELLKYLRNFGLDSYPLENWESGFQKILNIVTISMESLNSLLINGKRKNKN
jgi:hypothetical protein